ncbi:MAG: hypothetical protein KC502_19465 [Myxococcales bacterium]|nr:hypothetical protein [Myxococcales bacterium]
MPLSRLCLALLVMTGVATSGCMTGCSAPRHRYIRQQPNPRYTLVRRGAWLRQAPSLDAPGARDPVFATKTYKLGRAVSMEVVERRGQWVGVRPVLQRKGDKRKSLCVSTPWALKRLDIVLWVQHADLVPALRHEGGYRYSDGTSVLLRAGVPALMRTALRHPKRSIYAVRPSRFRLNTVLADRAVGLFFRRSRGFSNTPTDEKLDKKVEMKFGSTARVLDTYRWSSLYVQERRSLKSGELVTVRSKCATLKVLVRPDQILSVPSGAGGLGLSGVYGKNAATVMTVPKDVQLTWHNGQLAGRTHKTLHVKHEVPSPNELQRCFTWSIRTFWPKKSANRSESNLTLCAPRAEVQ